MVRGLSLENYKFHERKNVQKFEVLSQKVSAQNLCSSEASLEIYKVHPGNFTALGGCTLMFRDPVFNCLCANCILQRMVFATTIVFCAITCIAVPCLGYGCYARYYVARRARNRAVALCFVSASFIALFTSLCGYAFRDSSVAVLVIESTGGLIWAVMSSMGASLLGISNAKKTITIVFVFFITITICGLIWFSFEDHTTNAKFAVIMCVVSVICPQFAIFIFYWCSKNIEDEPQKKGT